MHDQRGLHAHRRAVARIDALDLARHQAVGRVVGGGAAVFLGQGGAQQAKRAELVHDLAIELLVAVGLQHARHQLVLAVVAGRIADRDLLLGELVVEEERVLPVERLGIGADALGGAFHRGGGGGHVCSWRCPPGLIRQCRPRQPSRPVRALKISRLSRPKASEARNSTVRGRGRSTLRSAAMRPGRGDMTTTRSDRKTASGIEWVTNSTVLRASRARSRSPQMRKQLERHVVAGHGIEGAERLVHQQQGRVEQQGAAQRGALLHAARQLARQLVAEPAQPRHVEELLGAAAQGAGVLAGELGRQQHVLQDRAPFQQDGRLEHHADVGNGLASRRGRRPSPCRPWPA